MFYAILALFIRLGIAHKSSKHSGIISICDKEIVQKRLISVSFSRILHQTFESRQKLDYKDIIELSQDEAIRLAGKAREFVSAIKELIAAPRKPSSSLNMILSNVKFPSKNEILKG